MDGSLPSPKFDTDTDPTAGTDNPLNPGPFANFLGSISEVNEERGRLKVMIEIFERLTSVEVEFWQVEKILKPDRRN